MTEKKDFNPIDIGSIEVTKTPSGKYEYYDPNATKSIFARIFGESLFGWTPSRVRRLSAPEELEVMKPGILSYRVLKDSVIFGWLGYLDEDPDANVDYAAQYTTEYANIGLLSALVFTVWVSLQIAGLSFSENLSDNEVFGLRVAYSIVWTLASSSVLFATICSITILLAINETTGPSEAEHFMRVFNEATFGVGSIIPLLLLYTGVVEGACGTCLWYFINYQSITHTLIVLVALIGVSGIFVFFVLQICSSLYVSRRTSKAIGKIDEKALSPTEIHDIYQSYVKSVGGSDYVDTEDAFINYVRANCGDVGYKCKLSVMSDKLCRRYFTAKFQENIAVQLRKIPGWNDELDQFAAFSTPHGRQKSSSALPWVKPLQNANGTNNGDGSSNPILPNGKSKRPSLAYNKVVPIGTSVDQE